MVLLNECVCTVVCVVQVEERYTQDALRAEERERGERKRVDELQETLRHSSYIDQQEKYALSNYQQIFACIIIIATALGHNYS